MERRLERLEAKYSQGVDNPALHVPLLDNSGYEKEVTDLFSWSTMFIIPFASAAVPAVQLRMSARHTGTTASIRLSSYDGAYSYGTALSITASSDPATVAGLGGDISFDWLHQIPTGASYNEWYILVQSNVDTGSGSVFGFPPYILTQARSAAATTGG
tara:strand:- start:2688 stop:3161 length:474 start_codon:yes stop_codon:yes gene_type:complete